MKEATVIAVIKSQGVFQLNPLAYRNDKTRRLLKSMERKGLVQKQRVNPSCLNYTLSGKAK